MSKKKYNLNQNPANRIAVLKARHKEQIDNYILVLDEYRYDMNALRRENEYLIKKIQRLEALKK